MKISHKNLAAALILMGMLAPMAAYAGDVSSNYTPLAPLPCIQGNGSPCPNGNGVAPPTVDVNTYVQYAFNLLIALAAVAAVFMITWGGFEYMTSVAPGSKSDGLGKVKNAIYGLILVLCSFLILKAINPQFVQVPVGLVPSLDLCTKNPSLCTNTLDTWATQLQSVLSSEVAANKADLATAQQTITQINAQLAQISNDENNAADGIYSYTGNSNIAQACADATTNNANPDLSSLCATWTSDQGQQVTLKSSASLTTAQTAINALVYACGTTGNLNNNVGTGNCYTNNKSAIDAVLSNPTLTSQMQPNDVQTLKTYAVAAQTNLDMDSLVSSYNQQLATYNLNNFGTGGTVSTIANTILRNTSSAVSGINAANYNAIVLEQTTTLAGIDSKLKAAQATLDPVTYQKLAAQAQVLKSEIVAPTKP